MAKKSNPESIEIIDFTESFAGNATFLNEEYEEAAKELQKDLGY
jgi:hypothetical protein